MRILSNEDIDQLLTMPECISIMEEMYRDYANGHALLAPRIDNISPTVEPGMGEGWWSAPGNRFAEYKDLAQLVAGHTPGRTNDSDVTCFVNIVGTSLQFAAAGALVLEKAHAAGLGHELPDEWFSETVHP